MQKKIILALGVIVTVMPQLVSAFEVTLQPRFKTGVLYYEYEQKAFQSVPRDPEGLFPNSTGELNFSDVLPFVGGGLTIFADRFFVDFSIQHAFDGEDSDSFRNSSFVTANEVVPADVVITNDQLQDTEFDRTEGAISVGYRISKHIGLYVGYLKAETDFDTNISGGIASFQAADLTPNPFLTGSIRGKLDQQLKYDGPFLGTTLTMNVNNGFLVGVLSGNASVAFLDGEVDLKFSDVFITDQFGTTSPIDLQGLQQEVGRGFTNLKGDTVALTLGFTWTGITSVAGLTYSVGATGYRYDFDSDDSNLAPDFAETQLRFDVGVAYAFDL